MSDIRVFSLKALEMLGAKVAPQDGAVFLAELPERLKKRCEGREKLLFTFDKEIFQASDRSDLELMTQGSPYLEALIEEVRELGCLALAAPARPAPSPQDVAAKVAAGYTFSGGTIKTGECFMATELVARLQYRLFCESIEKQERLVTLVLDSRGNVLDEAAFKTVLDDPLADSKGLDAVPLETVQRVVDCAEAELKKMLSSAEEALRAQVQSKKDAELAQMKEYFGAMKKEYEASASAAIDYAKKAEILSQMKSVEREYALRLQEIEERYGCRAGAEIVAAMLLLVPMAQGRTRFEVSEAVNAEVTFSVPAQAPSSPPYTCPVSGKKATALAYSSSGHIVAADEIELCAASGKPFARQFLKTCAATNRRLSEPYVTVCDVTGQTVGRDMLRKCPECQQDVSPMGLAAGTCWACQRRQAVGSSHPVVQKIMQKYPNLRSWPGWEVSETKWKYNVRLQGMLSRAVAVFKKDTLDCLCSAKGSKIFGGMKPVPVAQL
jgi:hypothetical protein